MFYIFPCIIHWKAYRTINCAMCAWLLSLKREQRNPFRHTEKCDWNHIRLCVDKVQFLSPIGYGFCFTAQKSKQNRTAFMFLTQVLIVDWQFWLI